MSSQSTGFISRFVTAWRSAATVEVREEPGKTEKSTEESNAADLQVKIETLKMDIEDRDRQIERLKKEYENMSRRACAELEEAGEDGIMGLAKRLAPFLSQSGAMRSLHEQGTKIRIDDLFKIVSKIETAVLETGLEPIGTVGEEVPFDARHHQRMSGGGVMDGLTVKVRFSGYRKDDHVLLKAMVSAKE